MKILTSSLAISDEIARLIHQCESCQIAVAWASAKFECFESLVSNKSKIDRMVVGLHFCQTHPQFIKTFLSDASRVRFVLNDTGVFHPKVYIFDHSQGRWSCVVGSPNFTKSAFTQNTETAVLIGHDDAGAEAAYAELTGLVANYWETAKAFSDLDLDEYRIAWKKCRKSRKGVHEATKSTMKALLPKAPAELSAFAFTSQVINTIGRIQGVSQRWQIADPGETLGLTLLHSADADIQLWISPKENKCYFEVVKRFAPEVRDAIAESIKVHLKTLRPPNDSELADKGGGVIRLRPPLHVKHLMNQGSGAVESNQRAFDDQVQRVVALFAFLDRAMPSWCVNPK